MPQLNLDVSADLLHTIDRMAGDFKQSRQEIVLRALDHYLGHAGEVRAAAHRAGAAGGSDRQWRAIKDTLQRARCAFDDCPFQGDCPVELCPL